MSTDFTLEELSFLLQSASYSKKRFEEYDYENEEMRKSQILEAENIIKKVRTMIATYQSYE